MSANVRRSIYVTALAVIGLLVGYNVLAEDKAGLWAALVTALLGLAPATALKNITPDPTDEDQ